MHCKYLSVVPYKALEKFSKAFYGTTGSTYSARVFRPVMTATRSSSNKDKMNETIPEHVRCKSIFDRNASYLCVRCFFKKTVINYR